jgi:hypothetical protein
MSSDSENGLSGLSGDPTVGELCDIHGNSKYNQSLTGGYVKIKGKLNEASSLYALPPPLVSPHGSFVCTG